MAKMAGVGSSVCFINCHIWIWDCFSTGPSQSKKESCLVVEEHKMFQNDLKQDLVGVLVAGKSPVGLAEQ